ncbi:uncharacterized protein LOC119370779 [Jatropha curcas]|uniref:uncharacterized protein LOC119370779 n=1 Tax=Jatropha curcas TaxID=180498 RepID=UPI001895BC71|nr:uncharacterized protein LOC119370779 [Jatropha curcas]
MSPELQRQHENMDSCTIILHLRELFYSQGRSERYETSKELFCYKMVEGFSVPVHVLKMIGYIEKLGHLGIAMDHELSIDLVLQFLSPSFSHSVLNFNVNKLDLSYLSCLLLGMLTTVEGALKKDTAPILLVRSSKAKKKPKKKQNKKKALKPNGGVTKENCTYHHCGKDGH